MRATSPSSIAQMRLQVLYIAAHGRSEAGSDRHAYHSPCLPRRPGTLLGDGARCLHRVGDQRGRPPSFESPHAVVRSRFASRSRAAPAMLNQLSTPELTHPNVAFVSRRAPCPIAARPLPPPGRRRRTALRTSPAAAAAARAAPAAVARAAAVAAAAAAAAAAIDATREPHPPAAVVARSTTGRCGRCRGDAPVPARMGSKGDTVTSHAA